MRNAITRSTTFGNEAETGNAPTLVWAICTVARSGSSWLSQLVASTQRMGIPEEYLLDWRKQALRLGFSRETSLEEYLWVLLRHRATPNGVFAIKGSVEELRPFFDFFPNAPCVWLSRENKLEQAVSWHKAHDGGLWTRTDTEMTSAPFEASLERIRFFHHEILRRENLWQEFFRRREVSPLMLTYEQVCLSPLESVKSIAAYIGIDPQTIHHVTSPLKVVRDATTAALVERAEQAAGSQRKS